MPYLHQDLTTKKAREFSDFLKQNGFETAIDLEGFGDYFAKIKIYSDSVLHGKLTVYYSPRKNRYKLTFQTLKKKNLIPELEDLWKQFQNETSSADIKADLHGYHAYVDGSFLKNKIGYGSVIMEDGKILAELSGKVDDKYAVHHQIAGELKAVIETVAYCKNNHIEPISIHFDYNGIEKWAVGKWKANKELTRLYQNYMIRQTLAVNWVKVKAHSGDKWNDHADELAKKGSQS